MDSGKTRGSFTMDASEAEVANPGKEGTDTWLTYKLRSSRKKKVVPVDAKHADEPEAATSESDCSESESEGTRTCRSSARHVCTVMAKFCSAKQKAVAQIGYGGLLQMVHINMVNLKFTIWLLSRIDLKTRSMPVGRDGRVFLRPKHLEYVIGVPSVGRKVCGLEPDNAQERADFVRLAMGATQFCSNPLKAAQSVVTKGWTEAVTEDTVDEFKIAFVVWINGRFLAPTTKHDTGLSDFWGSLYNTAEITEFNWGAYYLDHITDAAARIQDDMKHKRATKLISSCPLLSQMIYLDNIDVGNMSRPHSIFPWVIDFDSERLISKMINADLQPNQPGHCEQRWGASMARRREDSCYMASEAGQSSSSGPSCSQQGIETARLVDGRTIGPSFSPSIMRPVNASDFCEFLKQGYPDMIQSELVDYLKFHNARCILAANIFKDSIVRENMRLAAWILDKQKHESATRRVGEEYLSATESDTETEDKRRRLHKKAPMVEDSATPSTNGRSEAPARTGPFASRWPNIPGLPPIGSRVSERPHLEEDSEFPSFHLGVFTPEKKRGQQDNTPIRPDITNTADDTLETPITMKTEVATPHSPYTENVIYAECSLAAKWDISPKVLNLNATSLAAEYSDSPILKRSVKPATLARSPWAMGVKHPERDPSLTHSMYDWVSKTLSPELNRPWVVHSTPRYIEIEGVVLKKAVTSCECWGYDVFDIATRRIQQLDRRMYPAGIMWRLIFESDFGMHVLGNAIPSEVVAVRSQFTGGGVDFEIQRCRQIVIPIRTPKSWCAYAWDMKIRKINILDPMADLRNEDGTLTGHRSTIERLHAALANFITMFFDGWTQEWDNRSTSLIKSNSPTATTENSALYTLFNIVNFDGQKLAAEPSPEAIEQFKERMLYVMMSIEDNKGKVPLIFVHTIED